MKEQDKELLLAAVDNYDVYRETQRITLRTLIALSIDGMISISPTSLAKLMKLGRGIVYHNLRIFQEDGLIKNIGKDRNRRGLYKLNEIKLAEILEIYKNKSKYL